MFSGQGVVGLRKYLNHERSFADIRVPPPTEQHTNPAATPAQAGATLLDASIPHAHNPNLVFNDEEPDALDDDDVLEDVTEMAIDTLPLLGHNSTGPGIPAADPPTVLGANHLVPVPPVHAQAAQSAPATAPLFHWVDGHPPYVPQPVQVGENAASLSQPRQGTSNGAPGASTASTASTSSAVLATDVPAGFLAQLHSSGSRQASGTGPSTPQGHAQHTATSDA